MNIKKLFSSFEEHLAKLPGRPRYFVFAAGLCYLSASILPALQRGSEVMAGYQCLLWGPLSLVALTPLVFLVWCLNFEILFSAIEVLSPYRIRQSWRSRLALLVGLLIFTGLVLTDHESRQSVILQPRVGAFVWYLSLVLNYTARVKAMRNHKPHYSSERAEEPVLLIG